MPRRLLPLLFLNAAFAAGPALLFRHATLVDPATATARPGMAIRVEQGRIARLLPDGEAVAGAGVKVVDLRGQYVIPGLVDTHVHLATEPNLKEARAVLRLEGMGGIVAVRDMAGDGRFLADLRRQVLVGETPGPRLFFSALMAGPEFFVDPRTKACTLGETPGKVPWCLAVTHDTDLVQAVALARGTYASGIKLYANLDADLTARIVAEARRQGFPVWSHGALFPARPSDVVRTGLTSISHAPMLVYEVVPMPDARREHRPKPDYSVAPDQPAIQEVFRLMKEQDVALDATLSVFRHEALTKKGDQARAKGEYAFGVAITKLAYKAGVRITTGTDWDGRVRQGIPPLWDELAALQDEVGMSPADVLRAATVNGAKVLGLEAEDGALREGMRADFAVLRSDPLKDIKAINTLRLTVIGGRILDRAGYRPDPVLFRMKD